MIIKNAILSSCLLMLLFVSCSAQKKVSMNTYSNDSNYFDKRLPEYQVSPCLFNLLTSIEKSNTKFYSPTKFFYSLTFNKGNNQKYLNVTPEEWSNAKSMDYTGILKIKNVTFLFRGDFENDSLFKRKSLNRIRVKLQQSKDSTDIVPFFTEPSLDGAFYECKGLPIYVEVYTRGKVPGYERKVRH